METMGGVLGVRLSPHPAIQPLLVLVLVSQGGFAALLEVMGIPVWVPRGWLDRAEQEGLMGHHEMGPNQSPGYKHQTSSQSQPLPMVASAKLYPLHSPSDSQDFKSVHGALASRHQPLEN